MSSVLLSDSEKEKIRYHLGYLASGFAASLQFGLPRPVQTVFMLETAMNQLVQPQALERVRWLICTLDNTEKKLASMQNNMAVESVGNVKFRADPFTILEREYRRWASRLADVLGVPKYAFSERSQSAGPGNSIRVVG